MTEQDFHDAYERLAEEGACDSPGGLEYQRVLGDWIAAGKPPNVEQFIATRANADPFGESIADLN